MERSFKKKSDWTKRLLLMFRAGQSDLCLPAHRVGDSVRLLIGVRGDTAPIKLRCATVPN